MARSWSLFRLLRGDEWQNIHTAGIIAKDPWAMVPLEDHVCNGSSHGFQSQFISTCATFDAALVFASYKITQAFGLRLIAEINITQVMDIEPFKCFYLTKDCLFTSKAKHYARKFQEVLIIGRIPPARITRIHIIQNGIHTFMSLGEFVFKHMCDPIFRNQLQLYC